MSRRLLLLLVGVVLAGLAVVAPAGAPAQGGTVEVTAELSGDNEPQGGDPDGEGQFDARIRARRICYDLEFTVSSIPTDAHIHRGSEDQNGPIVVPLRPRFTQDGARSRCVPVRRTLARRIRRNPDNYYVNVHTRAFPNGAIRGQLEEAR